MNNQLLRVTINGEFVTIETATISEVVNRFYDVATFTIQEDQVLEHDVIIEYGDNTFNGFIYKTTKSSKLLYSIECRSYSAKLTEPYSQYTKGFDSPETSHDLCSFYANETGIPINITAGDLSFGGSYERTGTMITALSSIASTTGAEYWFDGTSIQIHPNKYISSGVDIDVPLGYVFDFVVKSKSVHNKGVGFVIIANGGEQTLDIVSYNKIYAEVDECTGDLFVYPNPYGSIEYSTGISSLSSYTTEKQESIGVLDVDLVVLKTAIGSIKSVTLNGISISDYHYKNNHNVLYFDSIKRGTLTIVYTAKGFKGTANITKTPIGRFVSFDMFYLDQILQFQGFLSSDCNGLTSTDGNMVCIVPKEMIYPKGFTVYTIGGIPSIIFYNKDHPLSRSVITANTLYTSVEDASLEPTGEEEPIFYRYNTRYPIEPTARGATASGSSIPFTTHSLDNEHYFEFEMYYPKVSVTYETPATSHSVQFTNIKDGEIVMAIKNENTNETCEYDLEGIDEDDIDLIPCEFGQSVPIDVAKELRMEVTQVKGKTLPYIKPDGGGGTAVVDSFGILKILVNMDGDFIIDTSSLSPRSTITLVSNVEG